MDSAMADCGDDGMSGEDTQCPHCARLKLELRGLRLKLERYRKESESRRDSLGGSQRTLTELTEDRGGIMIPGVRNASPWEDYGPPSQLSPSPLRIRSRTKEALDLHLLRKTTTNDKLEEGEARRGHGRAREETRRQRGEDEAEAGGTGACEAAEARDDGNGDDGDDDDGGGGERCCPDLVVDEAAVVAGEGKRRPAGSVLLGLTFLVTGFSGSETRAVASQLERHGGKVSPLSVCLQNAHDNVVVVAKDNTRTLKVLFALSVGRPVVKRSWVEESVKAGFPVEMKRSLLLWGPRNERLFAGQEFVLVGTTAFLTGGFKEVLQCGGAKIVTAPTWSFDSKKRKRGPALAELGENGEPRKPSAFILEDARLLGACDPAVFSGCKLLEYKVLTKAMAQGNVANLGLS